MNVMIYIKHNIIITYMQYNDKEILKTFGKLVLDIRKTKSNSLNKFAFSRGGTTSATISRIENGLVDFKFTTLIKLAYALDISLSELFKDFVYEYEPDD